MSQPKPEDVLLFVDDDPASRWAMGLVFRNAGFAVREAATGGEALQLAAQGADLVVLDVSLPDMSGFEVCRRLRAHPATANVPVLHLTGRFVRSEDRVHGLEGGADGYLTKPVEPAEVVAQARALLRAHRAEERAREAARQWQATFDAVADGVALLDRDGRVVRCNRALAALLGRPGEELVGRPWNELVPGPPGRRLVDAAFPRMMRSGHRESDEVAWGDRFLEVSADPLPGPSGAPGGAVFLVADVTERRRQEERLRQAERLEALGRLAAGVAHDFNNLLTAVVGNVALALTEVPPGDQRRWPLEAADRAAWLAAELVRGLLEFARQASPRLGPVNVADCLREALRLVRPALGPGIEAEVSCPEGLWEAEADAGQLGRVLLNMCLNARDAMPDGGRLVLAAENVTVTGEEAARHPQARPGEFVRLRVSDTGEGIPPDVLPHIFEPFFTTKGPGRGTGLGLATAFGIVRQHRGWIECTSTPGQGARFDVYLPRSVRTSPPAQARTPPGPAAG